MAKPKGWRNEPARHALAAKGIRTIPREILINMPWPSIEALPKVEPAPGTLQRIHNAIKTIDKEIDDYRDDPIMFTYVRLDEEITALEKELWTYTGRATDDAERKVKALREKLEESDAPWTN
jgi:hypothetical protein